MMHATELSLRRLFAGEAVAADLKAHSESCEQCKAKLREIEEEQRRFEAAIPFERFSAGVERAARNPREVAQPPKRQWVGYVMAIAASVLVVATVPLLIPRTHNGIKGDGDTSIVLQVAGAPGVPARKALPNVAEPLSTGERVEVFFSAYATQYVVTVSVDERGEVSSYPESGRSLPVTGKGHLPDSVEFTGHGLEHVVIVLSTEPLPVEDVKSALKLRYDEARGNLTQLGQLELPGQQLHYTFLKP